MVKEVDAEEAYFELDDKFICSQCGKQYVQLASLVKHLKKNHNVVDAVTYRCDICNGLFEMRKKIDQT